VWQGLLLVPCPATLGGPRPPGAQSTVPRTRHGLTPGAARAPHLQACRLCRPIYHTPHAQSHPQALSGSRFSPFHTDPDVKHNLCCLGQHIRPPRPLGCPSGLGLVAVAAPASTINPSPVHSTHSTHSFVQYARGRSSRIARRAQPCAARQQQGRQHELTEPTGSRVVPSWV
jgi:hypothetical protein